MSGFLDELWLRHDGAADHWTTARELRYVSRAGKTYTVPAGMTTDLASIPRVFWSIIPPHGKHLPATILHDWLYMSRSVSRKMADNLFREAMEELGVDHDTIDIMYKAVRAFGQEAYDTDEDGNPFPDVAGA